MRDRPCSLLAGIRIERGTREDWLALAPLHYRSHRAGAVTDIFRLVYQPPAPPTRRARRGDSWASAAAQGAPDSPTPRRTACRHRRRLIGVIVYSRSPLSLAARDRATGGRYRLTGRMAVGRLVNQELRIISRVVIAPNWRGLGLASRLAAETMPQVGTPYVEALAAMGEMHPLFVRAGMTAYPPTPTPQSERLRAAMEAVGCDRTARRSGGRLAHTLDALDPAARSLALREIARWARSYLGAKNHRVNRPDLARMLDLVARHLDSAPVYYLWRAPADAAPRADVRGDARTTERRAGKEHP